MKVVLIQDFNAQTTQGPRLLPAGKELDLAEDKARALIAAGIAEPADLPKPYLDQAGEVVIPVNASVRYKWWAGGQPARETLREIYEERAAIMEYDGGMTRAEAERRAAEITGYQPSPGEKAKSRPPEGRCSERTDPALCPTPCKKGDSNHESHRD